MSTEVKAPPASSGPAEVTGTALITLDPQTYVTAVFAPFRERLDMAKEAAAAVAVVDVSTTEGMKTAIAHRATFRAIRVEAEKARQFRKKPILDIGRLLDSRGNALEAEIVPLEERFDTAIKAEEKRKEDERQARERAEAERIARIEAAIREVRDTIIDAVGRPSAAIQEQIDAVHAINIDGTFFEFQERAAVARRETLEKLKDMHGAAVAQEQEASRIAAERADLERRQAEQAERERVERERADSELKRIATEQAHLLKMRAEQDAARQRAIEAREAAMSEINGISQQVIIAQIGRLGVRVGGTIACIEETLAETEAWTIEPEHFGALTETAQRAKDSAVAQIRALLDAARTREVEAARVREAQEKIDADRRALEALHRKERDAAEAKAKAERDAQDERERQERLRSEKQAHEEWERREAEHREREAEERRIREEAEARQREEQRKANELLDGRELLATFKARFGVHPEFAGVIKAIDFFLSGAPSKSRAKRFATQTS